MELTINNALHDRTFEHINLGIKDGKIVEVSAEEIKSGSRSIDAEGAVVSPAFIEPHFHLENSVMPEFPNHSGTLNEAIKITKEIKDQLTPEDIMRRSTISLKEAMLNGVLWLRDHTDVDEVAKLSLLEPVVAVRDKFKEVIDIEIVAFPQFGLADNPESVDLVRQAMEQGADLVGGVPHREKDMDKAARQIELAFEIALENDADIDMHVDETDDPYWHSLELLADKTIETGYQGRVTAGHCTAMAAWDEKLFQRVLDKLIKAQVNICTNTPVNLVIQGRGDGNPIRRGITRVKDLLEAGVNVIQFYPFGNMDPLNVGNFVAHTAHMSSSREIRQVYEMSRYNAAKALRLENYGLEVGDDANLVIFEANSPADALRRYQDRKYVIRKGEVLVQKETNLTLSPKLPFA